MKYRITMETSMTITRYALGPISCWPLPLGATRSVILRHNIILWTSIINLVFHIMGYVWTICVNTHDFMHIIKASAEMVSLISACLKITICKIEAPRLQILVAEMETFLKQATPEQRRCIQVYVDKCLMLNATVLVCVIFGPLIYMLEPFFTERTLPGIPHQPFSTEPYWIWLSCYISTCIIVLQVGSMVIVDVLFEMILWYLGARFHMLVVEFQNATNSNDIRRCIQQHQVLIGYAEQMKISTRIIALEVTAIAMLVVTIGGFILIQDPPSYEFAKYVAYELASAMELFLYTWPADNLIDLSGKVGDAAYSCDWIGKPLEIPKDILFVMARSRKPIIISVTGFLPVLSLEFYGSTMAATFSYLTALRTLAGESD